MIESDDRPSASGQSVGESGAPGWHLSARRGARRAIRLALPIIVLGAGGLGSATLFATAPDRAAAPGSEDVRFVEAVDVRVATFRPIMTVYGTTVAGRRLVLRSHVAGEVVSTGPRFRDGGTVAKGEKLIQINPFDYQGAVTEARSRVDESKALMRETEASIHRESNALRHARKQLAIAQADFERAVAAGRSNLSAKAVDDRHVTLSQRSQTVEEHENNIAVLKARAAQRAAVLERLEWRHEQAERRLAETELKAPFAGYLVGTDAQAGRMLNANDSIGTLIDKNWIEIRFTLSKAQFARLISESPVLSGRKVEVRWQLGPRLLVYPATIERMAANISEATGGVMIHARIDDPASPLPLRPGAFVEVRVPEGVYRDVVRLPATALYDGDTVHVIADGRLAPRKVVVMGSAGQDILVRGDLASGDQVVGSRLSDPKSGLKVKAL